MPTLIALTFMKSGPLPHGNTEVLCLFLILIKLILTLLTVLLRL